MANISYTKKGNKTWKFTIRQSQKYLYYKAGFTEKEEAEEEAKKAIQGIENVGYGRGFYLISYKMTVDNLCHIWV